MIRQFRLVSHAPGEVPTNNVFSGEIARLHSLQVQKPYVFYHYFLCKMYIIWTLYYKIIKFKTQKLQNLVHLKIIVFLKIIFNCRPYDAKNPFLAQIKVNRELHKRGDRSCLHIEFDISDSKMRYEAGKSLHNCIKNFGCRIEWYFK